MSSRAVSGLASGVTAPLLHKLGSQASRPAGKTRLQRTTPGIEDDSLRGGAGPLHGVAHVLVVESHLGELRVDSRHQVHLDGP